MPDSVPLPPNPGSPEAVAQGCICPVMDNGRGDPELGRIRGFVVVVGCPLHSPTARQQTRQHIDRARQATDRLDKIDF